MDPRNNKLAEQLIAQIASDEFHPEHYEDEVKKRYPDHAVVASLMVETEEEWRDIIARSIDAGADGLVLFNRFYQPDFDLEALEASPSLELSSPAEIRPGLLWLAALHARLGASLAASSGVETADQIVKYLLAGADAVMTTSSLLRHGIGHMAVLRQGLFDWFDQRGYDGVDQVRGLLSLENIADPRAFERANYLHVLQSRVIEGF